MYTLPVTGSSPPAKRPVAGQTLLQFLESPENTEALAQFSRRRFKKGHIMFWPHERRNEVFIVKKGKARIFLDMEGKELSLSILGPGDLYSTHSRAYVGAIDSTEVYVCAIPDFLKLSARYQKLSRCLFAAVGKMLNRSISLVENLYYYDLDKRVAAFFYEQALVHGESVEEGILVHVGLTVDKIATIVASSRQTVSSLISSFERDGILKKIARGEYLILDMDDLKYLARPCSE